jgi:hypothetical protein
MSEVEFAFWVFVSVLAFMAFGGLVSAVSRRGGRR